MLAILVNYCLRVVEVVIMLMNYLFIFNLQLVVICLAFCICNGEKNNRITLQRIVTRDDGEDGSLLAIRLSVRSAFYSLAFVASY